MDFFYPNFNNDFWRVMGLVHFDDAQHFVVPGAKRFNYEAVTEFCRQAGLAFFDTASKVRRLKDNASDAFLEILEPTDVGGLLARLPHCRSIVTTGGKASEQLAALLRSSTQLQPPVADTTSPFQGECALHSRSGRCLPVVASLLPHGTAADAAPLRGTAPLQTSHSQAPFSVPAPGGYLDITAWGRALRWWRMPSTSRAYPLALSAKAAAYARLWP